MTIIDARHTIKMSISKDDGFEPDSKIFFYVPGKELMNLSEEEGSDLIQRYAEAALLQLKMDITLRYMLIIEEIEYETYN